MAKKMTLDETWRLCISMWRWIAKQVKDGSKKGVIGLKRDWAKLHGFDDGIIEADCFLCEYASRQGGGWPGCGECPGKKIEGDFDCESEEHDWKDKPIKFYNKLVRLNKKRKK